MPYLNPLNIPLICICYKIYLKKGSRHPTHFFLASLMNFKILQHALKAGQICLKKDVSRSVFIPQPCRVIFFF